MGQQQLLLLVLGIVIVGLAVVVGIQAFSENQKKANADAIVNDAIRIASDAQAWKLKPAAFGGGAAAADWTGLDFDQMGYETGNQPYNAKVADADQYENLNAIYDMDASSDPLVITATSYETDGATLLNSVVVSVSGTSPNDITTVVN